MTARAGLGAAVLAVALLAAGCSGGEPDGSGDIARTGGSHGADPVLAPPPDPVDVGWEEADLPLPPGAPGRIAVRDATVCDGVWYLVGAIFPDGGVSRPAAWRSTDARTWTSLPFDPQGYWARRNVLSSVACRDDDVVMVGAKEGGAHGNPRVATWYRRPDGVYTDVVAPFSLYGGPEAVSVGPISAGPPAAGGWLIDGNRIYGAAVWRSPTGREFELVDHDPQLASDPRLRTFAIDHVYDGRAWTVVGSASTPGRVSPTPMAWTSPDGRSWTRQEIPPTEAYGDLERVVADDTGLLAAGLDGQRFGLWRRAGSSWSSEGTFGALDPEGRAFRGIGGLVSNGTVAFAAVSDGTTYAVWTGGADRADGWRPVTLPVTPTAAGEHVTALAATGDTVLLIADDGEQGRVFTASWTD